MSSSKVMADRMMLDIKALLLSLEYATYALQDSNKEMENRGSQTLEAARNDIQNVTEDYLMAVSLSNYYDYAMMEQCDKFNQVVEKIERGSFEEARVLLGDLKKQAEEKLSEHLRERVT